MAAVIQSSCGQARLTSSTACDRQSNLDFGFRGRVPRRHLLRQTKQEAKATDEQDSHHWELKAQAVGGVWILRSPCRTGLRSQPPGSADTKSLGFALSRPENQTPHAQKPILSGLRCGPTMHACVDTRHRCIHQQHHEDMQCGSVKISSHDSLCHLQPTSRPQPPLRGRRSGTTPRAAGWSCRRLHAQKHQSLCSHYDQPQAVPGCEVVCCSADTICLDRRQEAHIAGLHCPAAKPAAHSVPSL